MTLDKYMAQRRFWEAGLYLLVVLISFGANLGVELIDRGRAGVGVGVDGTGPLVLEITSHIAMALCIPLVLWFDHYFPIRVATWRRSFTSHFAFSFVFSFVHVFLMYWSRVAVFGAIETARPYQWDSWPVEFGYEYLKDFRTYLMILALTYLYRFILRRLQGEAGFLTEDADENPGAGVSDRFLVKKLGREFLVRVDEIDWIESCGNYVNLHVDDRVYPLRETMTRIDLRLVPMGFQRVHRSAIVNLDRVAEIVAYDTGDGQVKLHTEVVVPISRRFRQELRDRLA